MPLVIKMLKVAFSPQKTPNFECNSKLSEGRMIETNKDFNIFYTKKSIFHSQCPVGTGSVSVETLADQT